MKASRKASALRAVRNGGDVVRSAEPMDRKQAAVLCLFEAVDLIDDPAALELVRRAMVRLARDEA
jgi:hypothetical protein